MASRPETIVISSDEDDADESDDVVFIREVRESFPVPRVDESETRNSDKSSDKSNIIVVMDSPRKPKKARVSKTKLENLKRTVRKNRTARNDVSRKSSASDCEVQWSGNFKIDKARLKELKAVITLEMHRIKEDTPSFKVKEEKMDLYENPENATTYDDNPLPPDHLMGSSTRLHPATNPWLSQTGHKSLSLSQQSSPTLHQYRSPSKCFSDSVQTSMKSWLTPTKKLRESFTLPTVEHGSASAKRNEVVWPPFHVTLDPVGFVKKLYKQPKAFSDVVVDTIEGLQDEKFYFQVVKTVQSLMSSCCAPPWHIVWSMVNSMLSTSSDHELSFSTYCALMDIHAKFPAVCLMHITWQDIQYLLERFGSFPDNASDAKDGNIFLVLTFVLTVLASELKSIALKTRPTRITKMFSADFDFRIMKEVIAGIKKCLSDHCLSHPHSNCSGVGLSLIQKSSSCLSVRNGFCALELFQYLLKFVVVSSLRKEDVAMRMADELISLYMDLPSLSMRILLLQSLKSHLVRQYLIEVLLMNYCQLLPDALAGNNIPMGAKRILLQDFYRMPPRRSSSNDPDRRSSNEVEEYVTLVAYLLQSYTALHTPALQSCHGDFPVHKVEQVKYFTQEDVRRFHHLATHTSNLRKRCEGFLKDGQSLSLRTKLILEMMAMIAV